MNVFYAANLFILLTLSLFANFVNAWHGFERAIITIKNGSFDILNVRPTGDCRHALSVRDAQDLCNRRQDKRQQHNFTTQAIRLI